MAMEESGILLLGRKRMREASVIARPPGVRCLFLAVKQEPGSRGLGEVEEVDLGPRSRTGPLRNVRRGS